MSGWLPPANPARLAALGAVTAWLPAAQGDASPTPSLTMAPTDDVIRFQNGTAEQLIEELMSTNSDVEFRNVVGSAHLADCAAVFTNGRAAGRLMKKNATTHEPLKDGNGDYVPSKTWILPDRGVILSSGAPADLNDQDADNQSTNHGADGDADLAASVGRATYDACVLTFEFRCTSVAYVPAVSFRYIWGSDEYYEVSGLTFPRRKHVCVWIIPDKRGPKPFTNNADAGAAIC